MRFVESSLKIWLFSFYFPARSCCRYHSIFSFWKLGQKQKEQRQKQPETVRRTFMNSASVLSAESGGTALFHQWQVFYTFLFFNWMCGKYCCEENTCSLCFCTNTPDVILEIRGMSTVQKAPNVLRVFYYTCLINIYVY